MLRKSETAEQAARAIPESAQQQPDLPYVNVRSGSTRESFCIFIALGPPSTHATDGSFNSYGLSSTTSVPWF